MALAVAVRPHAGPSFSYGFNSRKKGFLSEGARRASGPASACGSCNLGAQNPNRFRRHVLRIRCEAGRDFDDRAGRIAEEVRRRAGDAARAFSCKAQDVLNDVKRKTMEFQENNDLQGKARWPARVANQMLEEFAYDMKRKIGRLDQEFHVSQKARQVVEYAAEQVQNLDRQLGARQKARNLSADLRMKWPTYRRRLSNFSETPLGKSVLTLFMLWCLVSGWAFRIFFFSLWFLPFAAPLLLGTLSRAAVVEGACPNCGARYIGARNQVVTCQRCRGVVWQPRQDFSNKKDEGDPTIIDVDIEKN